MRGGKRQGAGRKPGTPMVMYQVRVPRDIKEGLTALGSQVVREELTVIVKKGEGK